MTSLPDYSVQVQGLPPDTRPDEVIKFFEQWGDVAQVGAGHLQNTIIADIIHPSECVVIATRKCSCLIVLGQNRDDRNRIKQDSGVISCVACLLQVECARRCNILMTLVLDRESVLEELDRAIAVLQRSAELTPQVR